ncbi:MAG: hypothetical protein J3K34DRAFT_229048 [Monoraphidium minutum]|nr:MAG: hypothetical protein J3K34DRAFT_229048 [Monoraphidium minutum]
MTKKKRGGRRCQGREGGKSAAGPEEGCGAAAGHVGQWRLGGVQGQPSIGSCKRGQRAWGTHCGRKGLAVQHVSAAQGTAFPARLWGRRMRRGGGGSARHRASRLCARVRPRNPGSPVGAVTTSCAHPASPWLAPSLGRPQCARPRWALAPLSPGDGLRSPGKLSDPRRRPRIPPAHAPPGSRARMLSAFHAR